MKTLNQFIDELIALRDADPQTGDFPVEIEDQEVADSTFALGSAQVIDDMVVLGYSQLRTD